MPKKEALTPSNEIIQSNSCNLSALIDALAEQNIEGTIEEQIAIRQRLSLNMYLLQKYIQSQEQPLSSRQFTGILALGLVRMEPGAANTISGIFNKFKRHKQPFEGYLQETARDLTSRTLIEKFLLQKNETREDPDFFSQIDSIVMAVRTVLSPYEQRIFDLKMQGVSSNDIRKILSCSKKLIEKTLVRSRRFIEKELEQFDIKRVRSFNSGAFDQAASKGTLRAMYVLGMYYTTESEVKIFLIERSRKPDPDMQSKGYLLLSNECTPEEYKRLTNNPRRNPFNNYLTFYNNRIYISPENLALCKRILSNEVRAKDLDAAYSPLRAYSENENERQRLMYAARRGKLKVIKTLQGQYTTQKEIDKLRETQITRPRS